MLTEMLDKVDMGAVHVYLCRAHLLSWELELRHFGNLLLSNQATFLKLNYKGKITNLSKANNTLDARTKCKQKLCI